MSNSESGSVGGERNVSQSAVDESHFEFDWPVADCDFRTMCDRSLAGMYVIQDDSFRYANHAMAEILGFRQRDLRGASLSSFVLPDDRVHVEEQIRSRLAGDAEQIRFDARIVRVDGTVADVEILANRLLYEGRPALMGTIVDITSRKQAESATSDRLQFERLLADLSAGFVNLTPDEIEGQIDGSLRSLVEFLGNDRSTLVEFGSDPQHVMVTHSYAVDGCRPFPKGSLAVERLPWFIGQFRGGKAVFLKELPSDLPVEATREAEYCRENGVQSNVTIPLTVGGCVLGGLTFAFMKRACVWPEEIIFRLHLIGEVFANALVRRRNDESLRAALSENERLRQQLEHDNQYLRQQAVLQHHHVSFIGGSAAVIRVLAAAERVATTEAPVLLTGETGTGKEVLAHTIHELSARKDRPMVIVNCASLPATLIENELFGREAGAYTGAVSAQTGRFAAADGSTLFLDEIGELPVELQAKLLRVLEHGQFERVGSPKTVTVDVRIIAATNRDLGQGVQNGTFRADLYHRLNVFPIQLPPLRERRDDIPQLVWSFVDVLGRRTGRSITSITNTTMRQLQKYSWPGNVRELRNVVERAMILATDETLAIELPLETQQDRTSAMTLKEREREQILSVLQDTGWRIRGAGGAAEILEIKPTTLEAKMARLGIHRPTTDSNTS